MAKKETGKTPAKQSPKGELAKYDYGQYEGKGFENQTRDDVAIPFLTILQANSPQLDTIVDSKAGLLFNTVTEEVMREALIVPVLTQHVIVEWIPRDDGGGFVAVHQLDSPEVAAAKERSTEFGKYKMPNGNELVETFYVYVVLCNEKEPTGFAVIPFWSTKIKVYKRANTKWSSCMLMKQDGTKIHPPMFSHLTRVTTRGEENKKGKFHNFVLEPANGDIRNSMLSPDDPRFQAAAEFYQLINDGAIRIAYDSVQQPTGDAEDGEVPF